MSVHYMLYCMYRYYMLKYILSVHYIPQLIYVKTYVDYMLNNICYST